MRVCSLRQRLGARRVTVPDASHPAPENTGLRWHRTPAGWSAELAGGGDQAPQVATVLAAAGIAFSLAPPTLADVFEQMTGARLRASPS